MNLLATKAGRSAATGHRHAQQGNQTHRKRNPGPRRIRRPVAEKGRHSEQRARRRECHRRVARPESAGCRRHKMTCLKHPTSYSNVELILRFQTRGPSNQQAGRLSFVIPTGLTPLPVGGFFDQTCSNRIPVHGFKFLLDFMTRPDVESIITWLPDRLRVVYLRPIVSKSSSEQLFNHSG